MLWGLQSRYLEGALRPWPMASRLVPLLLQFNLLARLWKYVGGCAGRNFCEISLQSMVRPASTIHVRGPGTFPYTPSLSQLPRAKPGCCIFRVLNGNFPILDVCVLRSITLRSQIAATRSCGSCGRTCSGMCPRMTCILWTFPMIIFFDLFQDATLYCKVLRRCFILIFFLMLLTIPSLHFPRASYFHYSRSSIGDLRCSLFVLSRITFPVFRAQSVGC